MAGKLLTEFATLARQTDEGRGQQVPPPKLTDREMEVLKLVAKGMNNREIARELFISPLTAKTHVSRAMVKLGARDRAQLVVFAYESGLARPGWAG